jgi:hypothetical protein
MRCEAARLQDARSPQPAPQESATSPTGPRWPGNPTSSGAGRQQPGGCRSPLARLLTLRLARRYQRQDSSCPWLMPMRLVWVRSAAPKPASSGGRGAIHSPRSGSTSWASRERSIPKRRANSAGPAATHSGSPGMATARRSTPLAQSALCVTTFTQWCIPIPQQLAIRLALHQQEADELGGNRSAQGAAERQKKDLEVLRGAGRSCWLWEWLCMEVLRNADRGGVVGL